jgi:hypothetical protein
VVASSLSARTAPYLCTLVGNSHNNSTPCEWQPWQSPQLRHLPKPAAASCMCRRRFRSALPSVSSSGRRPGTQVSRVYDAKQVKGPGTSLSAESGIPLPVQCPAAPGKACRGTTAALAPGERWGGGASVLRRRRAGQTPSFPRAPAAAVCLKPWPPSRPIPCSACRDSQEAYRNQLWEFQFSLACDLHDLERRADSNPERVHALRLHLSSVSATLQRTHCRRRPARARRTSARRLLRQQCRSASPASSSSMAGMWDREIFFPAAYLAGKAQPSRALTESLYRQSSWQNGGAPLPPPLAPRSHPRCTLHHNLPALSHPHCAVPCVSAPDMLCVSTYGSGGSGGSDGSGRGGTVPFAGL